jgi:hypothetical protein
MNHSNLQPPMFVQKVMLKGYVSARLFYYMGKTLQGEGSFPLQEM